MLNLDYVLGASVIDVTLPSSFKEDGVNKSDITVNFSSPSVIFDYYGSEITENGHLIIKYIITKNAQKVNTDCYIFVRPTNK